MHNSKQNTSIYLPVISTPAKNSAPFFSESFQHSKVVNRAPFLYRKLRHVEKMEGISHGVEVCDVLGKI